MHRRTLVAGLGALATTGCLGVLTGREPLEREATPARVAAAALEETGYDLDDSYTQEVNREFTVAGQTREVRAINHVTVYHRAFELPVIGEIEAGVFAAVSTPAFEIAGETLNPVGDWSNRRLATQLQQQYSELEVGREVDRASVRTLGTTMAVSRFEGTATIEGRRIDVFLHVGKVKHGEDFVVALGIYPRQLGGERDRILALIRGLTHGG